MINLNNTKLLSFLFSLLFLANNLDCLAQIKTTEASNQPVIIDHVFVRVGHISSRLNFDDSFPTEITEIVEYILATNSIFSLNNTLQEDWPEKLKQNKNLQYTMTISIKEDALLSCGKLTMKLTNHSGIKVWSKTKAISGFISKTIDFHCEEKMVEQIVKFTGKMVNFLKKDQRDHYALAHSKEYLQRKSSYTTTRKYLPENTKTGITKDSIINYLISHRTHELEGIYDPLDKTGGIYTLGIIKTEDQFSIICLSSNQPNWIEGDLKASAPLLKLSEDPHTFVWHMFDGHEQIVKAEFVESNILVLDFSPTNIVKRFRKIDLGLDN